MPTRCVSGDYRNIHAGKNVKHYMLFVFMATIKLLNYGQTSLYGQPYYKEQFVWFQGKEVKCVKLTP